MVLKGMCLAIPPMTNTFIPMGGVIMPISMTMTIMMPHHIGSKPKPITRGNTKGVVKIIAEKNLILVKGAIPGANGDDILLRTAIKGQRAVRVAAAATAPKKDKEAAPAKKEAAKK